ncbi:chymotrypsinogen A-like [Dermacentor andersoni]|uniref:chymotrypsinogen A-like n=1 Tax=Dermacentor andersoni TaxID=34620 RepID=UPI002416261E|nr:chymotrypsinogen A-like [Dermacentor andersoni]
MISASKSVVVGTLLGFCLSWITGTLQKVQYGLNEKSCGLSVPEARIINGEVTSKLHVPWVVIVLRILDNFHVRSCGGSIITRNIILTAAHCVLTEEKGRSVRQLVVYYNSSDFYSGPCIDVKEGLIHNKYINVFQGYDIALLKLSSALPRFDRFVRSVCLPKRGAPTKAGPMLLPGYGTTSIENTLTDRLRFYTAQVFSDVDCDKGLHQEGQHTLNSDLVICSHSHFGMTWNGDSGSPVTAIMRNGKSTQYGIHSIGAENMDLPVPAMHTRVATFVRWIRKSLKHVDEWPMVVTEGPGNDEPLCNQLETAAV